MSNSATPWPVCGNTIIAGVLSESPCPPGHAQLRATPSSGPHCEDHRDGASKVSGCGVLGAGFRGTSKLPRKGTERHRLRPGAGSRRRGALWCHWASQAPPPADQPGGPGETRGRCQQFPGCLCCQYRGPRLHEELLSPTLNVPQHLLAPDRTVPPPHPGGAIFSSGVWAQEAMGA